jgi:hypothetical protein
VIKSDGTGAVCSVIYDDGTKVGIGATTLNAKLHVSYDGSNTDPQLLVHENANDTARINFQNTTAAKYWQANGYLNSGSDSLSQFNIKYGSTSSNILTLAGNLKAGILTSTPRTRFDINGDLAYRSAALTLANGQNNNVNIETSKFSYYRIAGPTAAFSVTGFFRGVDGRILTIYNSTSQTMTVDNQSGNSTAVNRIITGTGSNMSVSAGGSVTFQYNATDSRWIVISSNNTAVSGGGFWSTTGNGGTDTTLNFVGTTDATGLVFKTNNTYRMNILSNGQVSINSLTPVTGKLFSVYSTSADDAVYLSSTGTGRALYVVNSSTADAMRIDKTGNTGRALNVFLNAATNADVALSVSHSGTGYVSRFQQLQAAATSAAIYATVAGKQRVIQAQNADTLATGAVGWFQQASKGLAPLLYQSAAAVYGLSAGIRGGLFTASGLDDNTHAVHGEINHAGSFNSVGVFGVATPAVGVGYGVVGVGNNYGVFSNGGFGGTGGKSFVIDHPFEPENKFLKHFSIESPEILNVYRGNVILDDNGEAVVLLPNYFNAINKEFSYVLTPIGKKADLFIKTEVDANGTFSIAGGEKGLKVSWYVYSERNDQYMQYYPEQKKVEVDKKGSEVGKYLRPEIYGQPEEKGIFYSPKYKHEEPQPQGDPAGKEEEKK